MLEINRHRFFLVQILKDIYSDITLGNYLGFKGGSALMFFYELPRFSVDLDFNLLDVSKEKHVYNKVRKILLKYGKIQDEAIKHYGPLIVLDYGINERKLKVEISKREFHDRYEIKNLLGITLKVMVPQDMFAHKLCALLDRDTVAGRDVFDCWFFMQRQTPINKKIVEKRMKLPYEQYIDACIEKIESMPQRGFLQGIGELLEDNMKKFVKNNLRTDLIRLLRFYKDYPI
jgi:predicted nucleotidyltransferase component of viral defense system